MRLTADLRVLMRGDPNRPNVEYGEHTDAIEGEILRTVVGSGVHGIAIEGTDDHDEMGVFIEPPGAVIGTLPEQPDFIWRTRPEGERSNAGDTDLVLHSLRKYLRLAAVGNPTALLPLFAPFGSILVITATGSALREIRGAFLSQRAVHRFLGYMRNQHERMMGEGKRNRVPNRPELIEQFGWDVKYGSHALRLAYQGFEIAAMGRLTLPMAEDPRAHVLAVKRGEVPREEVSATIDSLAATVEGLLKHGTPLPLEPDWQTINLFSMRARTCTPGGWTCRGTGTRTRSGPPTCSPVEATQGARPGQRRGL